MKKEDFINTESFAELAGISRRRATKALGRAFDGHSWNGHQLVVRQVSGRGGRSGVCFEVLLSSIPHEKPDEKTFQNLDEIYSAKTTQEVRNFCSKYIILSGLEGSKERSSTIEKLSKTVRFPDGKRAGKLISERTLRSWVLAYEKRGILSSRRVVRADRGKARVIAWREWDQAMMKACLSEEEQQKIAKKIDIAVRSYWRSGATSVNNIQCFMQDDCKKILSSVGITSENTDFDALCRVPAHYIGHKDRKRARLAHIKSKDAAGYASGYVSRVRRHRIGLLPMDMVSADVRHSDIYYERADGSLASPKMVAFLDLATNRIFACIFLLDKDEMIRREHVLIALRDMMADPAWGIPKQLYIDNGGEFNTGEAADDLARLVDTVRDIHRIEMGIYDKATSTSIGTIRSLPYNPQSKVIEGTFSNFTRSIEPMFPGFVGGNRMMKKVEHQGRPPKPMPGDAVEIQRQFQTMVDFQNARPQQRGTIAGRSPNQALEAFQAGADGWRSVRLDPREFELAFGRNEKRMIQTGGELTIKNRIYRADKLADMVGERVVVRVPLMGDRKRVVILKDNKEPFCVADEVQIYGMQDVAGAGEQSRRRRDLGARVKDAVKDTTIRDLPKAMETFVQNQPKALLPEPLATVSIHPVLREAAEAPIALPPPCKANGRAAFAAIKALRRHAG